MKKSMGAKTIVYPTPVFIVGTYDQTGKPNAMTVAWGGICCSVPPCVAISLRRATYTYGNILEQKAFTISIPAEDDVKKADYLGMVSGRGADKFKTAGLTPVKSDLVNAPYVHEFPLVLECQLRHTLEIGLHTQFIGEILGVKAEETVLGDNGQTDIQKIKPILFDPDNQRYFGVGRFLGRAFAIGEIIHTPH
jgi:flavin reductase (DIM6/NTAB) family NADH-FMN oxidoreductase RutF